MQPARNIDGQYFEKILTSLLDFLLLAGVGVDEIETQVKKHLNGADNVRLGRALAADKGDSYSSDTVSAAILHRWFRDPLSLFAAPVWWSERPVEDTSQSPEWRRLVGCIR